MIVSSFNRLSMMNNVNESLLVKEEKLHIWKKNEFKKSFKSEVSTFFSLFIDYFHLKRRSGSDLAA